MTYGDQVVICLSHCHIFVVYIRQGKLSFARSQDGLATVVTRLLLGLPGH
jgi:hypothetical protein